MFKAKQYRDQASEYATRNKTALGPNEAREFANLEKRFTTLADNEDWLSEKHRKMVGAPAIEAAEGPTTKNQEEHLLRCLGAALITQWDTLPPVIRRELFDSVSTMGDALDTISLRQRIARFLHKHHDRVLPLREVG